MFVRGTWEEEEETGEGGVGEGRRRRCCPGQSASAEEKWFTPEGKIGRDFRVVSSSTDGRGTNLPGSDVHFYHPSDFPALFLRQEVKRQIVPKLFSAPLLYHRVSV